jgi:hypothetical protein
MSEISETMSTECKKGRSGGMTAFPSETPFLFYKKIHSRKPEEHWKNKAGTAQRTSYTEEYHLETRANKKLGKSSCLL